jgi:AraC-like DNA-binding protein
MFWRDSGLPGIELRLSRYDRRTFPKHSHDSYAIGLVHSGESTFYYRGGHHRIGAGQLALIPPGEIHSCNPEEGRSWSYRMWYIAPERMHRLAEEISGAGSRPRFRSPIAQDGPVARHLLHFSSLLEDGSSDAGAREEALHSLLFSLLTRLGECRPPAAIAGCPSAVNRAEEYLRANIGETVSLESLASLTGLSPWHFLRLFRAAKGLPPHAFQTQLRIDLARRLLSRGEEIADVAYRLGFSDQCHFSRKFRQFTGATPGQYRTARGR